MWNRIIRRILVLVTGVIVLAGAVGCSSDNRLQVDTSAVQVDMPFACLHDTLFRIPFDSLEQAVPDLALRYGDFFDFYSQYIIRIGATNTAEYADLLKDFHSYVVGNGLDAAVRRVFPSTDGLREQLTEAMRHYRYHFPQARVPKVYTYISGLQESVVIGDDFLGISLDKYLGSEEGIYARTSVEKYKRLKMYPERVAVDCMQAIAITEFEYRDSVNTLLAQMVYQGQILYFLDAMLPDVPDSVKIGYTAHNMRWAEHNEKDVWDFLIAQKALFSTDPMEIRKYVGEGPFTTPFTNNSPPQIGVWVGWQIVRSYMQNKPDVSLAQLMRTTNYPDILRYSRYRP